MRRLRWFVIMIVLVVTAACAPIEGIDGEEDNLPSMDRDEVVETPLGPEEEPEAPAETTSEEVIPEEDPIEVNFVRIKADALNVRREAGIENDKLGKVFDGQIYEVLDIQPDAEGLPWYKLTTPEDITGWVSSEYCVPGETYEDLIQEKAE